MKIKSVKRWRNAMLIFSLVLTFCTVATLPTIILPFLFALPMISCWMMYKFLYDMAELTDYKFGRIFIKDGDDVPRATKYYVMIKKGNVESPLTSGNILVSKSEMNKKLTSFLQLQKKDFGIEPVYVSSPDLSICVNAQKFANKSLKLEEN